MRKILFVLITLLLIFLSGSKSTASVNSYIFSQSITTYTPIPTGIIVISSPGHGSYTYGPFDIGFSFKYNGTVFNTMGISDNGWMQIGSLNRPPNLTLNLICNGSIANVLCPFNGDLYSYTDTLRYLTTGTAPTRVCTIEWCRYGFFSLGSNEISFEVKLYETSNIIQFIYQPTNPVSMVENLQVGLAGNNNSDFNTRTTFTDWIGTTAGTACSNMYFIAPNIVPANGLTFTFTPPGNCTTGSFPFGYGFGTTGSLDECWTFEQVTGYLNWRVDSVSHFPQQTPYQGPYMALFPSYSDSGNQARIKSPVLNFAVFPYPELSFFMSRDNLNPVHPDSVIVEVTTNNGTNWTFVASYQRYSSSFTPYWEQKILDLGQYSGNNNVQVGIRGVALHGGNICIDTILIKQIESVPMVLTTLTVATGSNTAKSGGSVTSISPIQAVGVCWNTTGSPTIANSHTNDGNHSPYNSFITGLNENQLYHVRAYATNSAGTGYGNELTLTTCSSVSLPYSEGFTGIEGPGSWPCGWSNLNPNYVTTSLDSGCTTANSGVFYYSNSSKWIFTPGIELFGGLQYQFSVRYKTDGYSGWQTFQAQFGLYPNSESMLPITGAEVHNPTNTNCVQMEGTFSPPSWGTYFIGLNCVDNGLPWYFTFDDISLTEVVGISKKDEQIPKSYCLYQNYPNPFNPVTKIKFDLPAGDSHAFQVQLTIYDLLGRKVAVLVNEKLTPGKYEVTWSANGRASNYSSGVYFYKLETPNYTSIKKMVLIK